MALPKVGVEAVIEGMAKFEADSKKVNQSVEGTGKAIDNMAAKAAAAGLKFDEASGRWRRATGQFASDAELAALGIKKAGDSADTASRKFGGFSLSLGGILPTLASLGASLLKIGIIAGGAALAGVTALAAGLATFAVGGIKQAIDLDQQVANIAATMGATRETAGTLKDELKGLALDLSLNPNLTVDVTQAGEAIEVLAANGALATDEFGKLTEASKDLAVQTVALANATGSDFTTAATIATDAMALFGLETSEMSKAVDGAAGIMNASKFSAQDYQLALSNAGGIAAEMGISIEDFNTVLAGTASNFASGSDAGTSFKTLMQRLANPTDEVKAAMQQYGISLFDASGNMRSMADIAQDLNQVFNGTVTVTSQVGGATKEQAKAAEQASAKIGDLTRNVALQEEKYQLALDVYNEHLKYYDASEPKMRAEALALEGMANKITDNKEKLAGYQAALDTVAGSQARTVTSTQQLTEAQKAQLAATLGGADGSRILLGLADLTAQEFNALSESVNRSGQGLEAAALRVDTVKGAMDIFKGVLQAIQIQIGDQFLPLLKQIAVNFTQFATDMGPQVVAFFGQVADSIGQIITKGQELFAIFQAQGAGGLLSALGISPDGIALFQKVSTLITDISTAISTSLVPALSSITAGGIMDSINTGLTFLNQHFEEIKGALLGIAGVAAAGVFAALIAGVMALLTPVNLLVVAAGLLGAAWVGNWGNIQGIVGSVVAYITQQFNTLMGLLQPSITSLQESFARLSATFAQTGVDSSALTSILSSMGNFIVGVLIPAWVQWIGFLAGVAAKTISLWVTYIQAVYSAWQTLSAFIQSDVIPVFLAINDGITVINSILASFGNLVIAVVNKALQAMAGLWQNVVFPALKRTGDFLNANLFPVFQSIGKTVNEDVSPSLRTLGEEIFPILQTGLDYVTEAIKKTISFFDSLAAKVNSFTLPDILTPGSPPPMAIAMIDIANATSAANDAVKGMLDSLTSNKWGEIQKNVLDLVDDMQDEGFYAKRGFGKSTGFAIKQAFIRAFTKNFQGILSGTITGDALKALTQREAGAYAERVQGSFNTIIQKARAAGLKMLRDLQQELLEALPSMAGGLAGLASQFGEFLEPQISERGAFIKKMQDFLASGSDELFRFDFAPHLVGVDHVMMDRIRAQEQLNLLLREQQAQEKEITRQKEAQQKLSFLQAQVDLIKLGRELGGNVFQGITFGLNASVEDLLRATNNVVEAMVQQIDTTLGIASDSKVMIKKFRDDVGGGMIQGLMEVKPLLAGAVAPMLSPMVAGPLSPAMAGAMNSSSVSTTNIFNTGGNTISNGMNAAEFEARVLQVIRRNL